LPGLPEVHALPVDASPGIPEVHELPVDASPGIPEVHELPIVVRLPRAISRAPPGPNPAANPPHPPPGNLRVEVLWVAFELRRERRALADEPDVPRMLIVLVHRPVGMMRDLLRIGCHSAPEVRNESVLVVHGFDLRCVRSVEQHGE
jgi:hypothetical protein